MKETAHVNSIFKQNELTKEDYTRKWIELIAILERNKPI